jgi:excinuclease UvrABC ATPase subunit
MSDDYFSDIAKRMKQIAKDEGRVVDPISDKIKDELEASISIGTTNSGVCGTCTGEGWKVTYEFGSRIERECPTCKNPKGYPPPYNDDCC